MVPRSTPTWLAVTRLVVAAAILTTTRAAAADESEPTSVAPAASTASTAPVALPAATTKAPSIGDGMRGYYASEKATAFTFVAVGSASAAGGAVLLATAPHGGSGEFARGLGWSLVAVGALEAAGAAFYAVQVAGEQDHYEEALARDPSAFKREELTHIHGTTSRFVLYRATELGLAIAGAAVATYGFAKNQDTWKGVGIGVGAEALTFFVLDAFGQARATEYEDQVRRFAPQVGVQIGGGERPWGISAGGLF
jgi:hypothetical protein